MATPDKYAPPSEADVARLVREFPFAWVVTASADGLAATPLPLMPHVDPQGRIVKLIGHFARSNPHCALAQRHPRALVMFMGPHGYVSSSWLRDRTRTPTWNYASAQYVVDLKFVDDEAGTNATLHEQVEIMERGRERPWSPLEMGERYRSLVRGIAAFEAVVVERCIKFKLGQDERDSEYADIVAALGRSGDDTLLDWMRRANPGRES